MAHSPALDIVNYLSAHSTALTVGTNLFRGPVRANSTGANVPTEAVFVVSPGGREPDRVLGTATEIRYPTVLVHVRSNSYTSGETLAQAVYDTLQSASPSTTNTYLDVMALQSGPFFLEQDKNMHYHWSLNFRLMYNTT